MKEDLGKGGSGKKCSTTWPKNPRKEGRHHFQCRRMESFGSAHNYSIRGNVRLDALYIQECVSEREREIVCLHTYIYIYMNMSVGGEKGECDNSKGKHGEVDTKVCK